MKTKQTWSDGSDHRQLYNRRSVLKRSLVMSVFGSFWIALPALAEDNATPNNSKNMNHNSRLFTFVGGGEGKWKVTAVRAVTGEAMPAIERLNIVSGNVAPSKGNTWVLRGVTSNERYITRPEKEQLLAKQPALGRPEADCAVLIPIRKSEKWWALTQGERRQVFEAQSHHTQIGLDYLPAIARRLHHCRDLADPEPFDFLTWFEFAKPDTAEFDRLLAKLRASEEWKYVEREVEIRVTRDGAAATK
jgi:hypothetical protein